MTTVLVAGAVANKPGNAGAAWTRLSWALGFAELGFDVHLVEEVAAASLTDRAGRPSALAGSVQLEWFRRATAAVNVPATLVADDGTWWGLPPGDLAALAGRAVMLVNISGHLTLAAVRDRAPLQVFVDLDPGFTQFWLAQGATGVGTEGHDHYVTVGLNLGAEDCPVPLDGIDWRPVRQPVVLDLWPEAPRRSTDRFTTIGSWRGPYGPVVSGGVTYGRKVHEFRRFADVPSRVGDARFEVALDIDPADAADAELLRGCGWRVADPAVVAGDIERFRAYVAGSAGEFSVAQGMYVTARTGWFSDRSVRYLASGRPVVVQDTGLAGHLPLGEGLLAFSTVDEAVASVEAVTADHRRHATAARRLAEELFAAPAALQDLCREVGVAA